MALEHFHNSSHYNLRMQWTVIKVTCKVLKDKFKKCVSIIFNTLQKLDQQN